MQVHVSGTAPVDVAGVENVDLSDIVEKVSSKGPEGVGLPFT